MNGLDKIIQKIISDAQEKAKQCEDETTSEIERLKAEAVDEIMRMELVYISRAERVSEEILMRAESSSSLEARNIILEAKTALIDKAFKMSLEKLLSMPKNQYIELVSNALAYAIGERKSSKEHILELYGEEEAELDIEYEVIFNSRDTENGNARKIFTTVKEKIDKSIKLVLSKQTADIDGGFILKCNDIEINCSLTALVNEARARCEGKIIQALF
ncbi:MAG: V-type ATP synthase subunit E [Clostridia bacterium]|nr:V-type ATP synthase subunit E [Clostridia bacterium]